MFSFAASSISIRFSLASKNKYESNVFLCLSEVLNSILSHKVSTSLKSDLVVFRSSAYGFERKKKLKGGIASIVSIAPNPTFLKATSANTRFS